MSAAFRSLMSTSRVEISDPEAMKQLDLVSTFVYVNYVTNETVMGESDNEVLTWLSFSYVCRSAVLLRPCCYMCLP